MISSYEELNDFHYDYELSAEREVRLSGAGTLDLQLDPVYYWDTTLRELYVGDGVTDIADDCCNGCENLSVISLPSSLNRIGYAAFSGCALRKLVLPSSLIELCDNAFRINYISSLEIPESLTSLPYCCFSFNSMTELSLPRSMRCLNIHCFGECFELSSVQFNDGLEYIDDEAFQYCNLTGKLDLPDTLKVLGDAAFENNINISCVTMPSELCVFGNPFARCPRLSSEEQFIFGETPRYIKLCKYGIMDNDGVLRIGLAKTTERTDIPSIIGAAAFADQHALISVELTSQTSCIETNAFSGCSALVNVKLGSNIKSIHDNAFSNCGIENLEWNASAAEIPDYCFYENPNLHEAIIPNSVSAFGIGCFSSDFKKPFRLILSDDYETAPNAYYSSFGSAATIIVKNIEMLSKFRQKWSNVNYYMLTTLSAIQSFDRINITGIQNKAYTGEPVTQTLSVTYQSGGDVNQNEYYVVYENNVEVGTATCIVKGSSIWFGEQRFNFTIKPADINDAVARLTEEN